MSKILIIDGNSLMFRAYYATAYTGNLMQNNKGLYTNAVYGFSNMINSLVSELTKDDYIYVAFDAGSKTFRHQEYDQYKKGRKPMPSEFKVQIPYIKKYLTSLNIVHMESDEYEADDLVASVSKIASNEGIDDIQVISGDKDLLQLVQGKVRVSLTKRGITDLDTYTEENFYSKMGIYPNQIPDYKGLVGDSSDNLPGIKGIGDKTACKLLNQYHTLESIVEDAKSDDGKIKGKIKEKINTSYETGLYCKKLATLAMDVDIKKNIEELKFKKPNTEMLVELYEELEFNSFLKRIGITKTKIDTKDIAYDIADINYDFSDFEDSYIIPEVFGSNYYKGQLLGIGIKSNDKYVFCPKEIISQNKTLIKYLESQKEKNTFDYKKLYVSLKKEGVLINNVVFDGLLGVYLINPKLSNEDYQIALARFLEEAVNTEDMIYGKGAKYQIPNREVYEKYNISKVASLKQVKEVINKKVLEYGLKSLFKLEIKLSEVLGDIELTGLNVDNKKLAEVGEEFNLRKQEYQEKIYEIAGEEFNLNSPKQLGKILFEKLGIKAIKKTKTGYSTNAEVLEQLASEYQIASDVLQYRFYHKIISTYVEGMKSCYDDKGFIHPLYKQALTVTGRLSSVEPNIQNMPIRKKEGEIIRSVFVSRFKDGYIMSIDYSQIELRVLSHMANDEAMIEAFNSGEDFHKETASKIFGLPINMIDKKMRSSAKAINFGVVYGMSAWGLSNTADLPVDKAQLYIDKYFIMHKGVDDYLNKCVADAKIQGYTKTLHGRRRYIPELTSSNRSLRNFGERTAMNSPIQGTAADILKFAMVEVSNQMKAKKFKSLLIAQVHDELVFDVEKNELEEMKELVKKVMENIVKLKVPLIADVNFGKSWLKD